MATDDEDLSLRETIEAVTKESGGDETSSVIEPLKVETKETPAAEPGVKDGDKKVETPAPKVIDRNRGKKPAGPVVETKPGVPPVEGLKPGEKLPAALKAPQSFKPDIREQWSTIPAEVQKEILRVEAAARTALNESATHKKFSAQFQQAVAPFEAMIRAEGSEPMKAIGELLQTAASLRMGSPQTKAHLVAQLINGYGVDIPMLDQLLSGQAAQQPTGQQGQYKDPRVDQLLAQMQQAQQQREASITDKATKDVAEFGADKEFFEDVKHEMADLLEVASRRGLSMSLDDAYTRAVALHPEVSKVFKQREEAKSAEKANASTQRSRMAASSVKNAPSGVSRERNENASLRDDILASLASLTGR